MAYQDERLSLLVYIEKHIDEGQAHIAKMQLLVADGERQRFDMTEAKLRLAEFLTAQAWRLAHRKQVLAELRRAG
jgi:phage/plasmid-associated DNA primase